MHLCIMQTFLRCSMFSCRDTSKIKLMCWTHFRYCFSKFNSDFSLSVLRDIEVVAINKPKDRLMNKLKIGREGWLEEGRQEGIEAVALRMLKKGMSVTEICSITKLSRNAVSRLELENSEPRRARKRA